MNSSITIEMQEKNELKLNKSNRCQHYKRKLKWNSIKGWLHAQMISYESSSIKSLEFLSLSEK